MNVIVTGATSFIGAAVVRRLLAQGDQVYAVVRPGSKNLRHLTEMTGPGHEGVCSRLQLIALDLHDIGRLPELPAPVCADVWIHAGWDGAGSDNRRKRDVQQANVVQSLAAVRAAAACGCRRFIFTGSQAEYGIYHQMVSEDMACHPVSEYGKAKTDFANQAKPLCKMLKIEYIHTRIFSVYGPGDHPWSLVQTCLDTWRRGRQMSLGPCTQQWNFLYIEDMAAALCHLVTEGEPGVYNIAGRDTRPLREYIEEMHSLCGSQGSFVYGERPQNAEGAADLMPDISRILRETSWQPEVSFADGIRKMWEE